MAPEPCAPYLFQAVLILCAAYVSSGTFVKCPYFPCTGTVPGTIDRPELRSFTTVQRTSKGQCVEKCIKAPNCVYYTFSRKLKKSDTKCYLFNASACEPYVFKKQRRDPYYPKSTISGWTFETGRFGCNASVVGDPHFTGADNSHFEFTGKPGNNYCLLSDAHLHINAYFGGRFDVWGDDPSKPLTWIRRLGILWGHDTITFSAREDADWHYGNGYMQRMEINGEPFSLGQEGDSVEFQGGKIRLLWAAAKRPSGDDLVDVYVLSIQDVLELKMTLRPEVPLLRTSDDSVIHFGLQILRVALSSQTHGVLGQTYRQDHLGRLSKQKLIHSRLLNMDVVVGRDAEGFLDGRPEDYVSTGLLAPDCKNTRFSRARFLDFETTRAIELATGKALSYAGRKLLGLAQHFRRVAHAP